MHSHWSLVLFTLLIQSAVGSVWCLQAASLGGVDLNGLLQLKYQLLTALCLTGAGLCCAFLHLGKPTNSYNALNNLKRSWLSREIATVNLFSGVLLLMVIWVHINPWALNGWMLLVGSLTGGGALYTMIRVYRLRTVPAWNHAGTPLSFLGSALLLGGLQCTLVAYILSLLQTGSPVTMEPASHLNIVFITAVTTGLIFKFMAAGLNPVKSSSLGALITLQPFMQAGGVVLWIVTIFINRNEVIQSLLLILLAFFLIFGEIIHRAQFYASHQRVGL